MALQKRLWPKSFVFGWPQVLQVLKDTSLVYLLFCTPAASSSALRRRFLFVERDTGAAGRGATGAEGEVERGQELLTDDLHPSALNPAGAGTGVLTQDLAVELPGRTAVALAGRLPGRSLGACPALFGGRTVWPLMLMVSGPEVPAEQEAPSWSRRCGRQWSGPGSGRSAPGCCPSD